MQYASRKSKENLKNYRGMFGLLQYNPSIWILTLLRPSATSPSRNTRLRLAAASPCKLRSAHHELQTYPASAGPTSCSFPPWVQRLKNLLFNICKLANPKLVRRFAKCALAAFLLPDCSFLCCILDRCNLSFHFPNLLCRSPLQQGSRKAVTF